MKSNKKYGVAFSHDFEKEYLTITEEATQKKQSGTKPTSKQLLKSLDHAFNVLKINVFAGTLIPAKDIDKKTIVKYGTNKIFKFDLIDFWRLIYIVKGNGEEITALILQKLPHKEYNKIYKGKTKKK